MKLIKNLLSVKSWKDNFKFVLFIAAMNGVYKIVLCTLRRLFKTDKLAAPIAGFIAGLCCAIDSDKRRRLLLVLLLTRLSDVCFSLGEVRGLCPNLNSMNFSMFLILSTFCQYFFFCEGDCLDNKLYKFVKQHVLVHKPDTNFHLILSAWHQHVDEQLPVRNRILSNWALQLN